MRWWPRSCASRARSIHHDAERHGARGPARQVAGEGPLHRAGGAGGGLGSHGTHERRRACATRRGGHQRVRRGRVVHLEAAERCRPLVEVRDRVDERVAGLRGAAVHGFREAQPGVVRLAHQREVRAVVVEHQRVVRQRERGAHVQRLLLPLASRGRHRDLHEHAHALVRGDGDGGGDLRLAGVQPAVAVGVAEHRLAPAWRGRGG